MDWKRRENNIHDKFTLWFEMIREAFQDPAILPDNVYIMHETGGHIMHDRLRQSPFRLGRSARV